MLLVKVVEQAAWALGNIAGDSPELRDIALDCGVLPKFVTVRHGSMQRV